MASNNDGKPPLRRNRSDRNFSLDSTTKKDRLKQGAESENYLILTESASNAQFPFPQSPKQAKKDECEAQAIGWHKYADERRYCGDPVSANKAYTVSLQSLSSAPVSSLVAIHAKRASVWVQLGRYKEAEEYLNEIQRCLDLLKDTYSQGDEGREQIRRNLRWWSAVNSWRLGDHKRVRQHTRCGPFALWDLMNATYNEVKAAFRSQLLHALANASLGYFESAEAELQNTRHWFDVSGFFNVDGTSASTGPTAPDENAKPYEDTANPFRSEWLASLDHTSAYIHQLSGRWTEALEDSESAVRAWGRERGTESIHALDAAILRALLLAQTSQAFLAESVCDQALEVVIRRLGQEHPLATEGKRVMAYISLCQGKYINALIATSSVCFHSERTVGHEHPLTLQSRSQLGMIQIATGQYRDAVETLNHVVGDSRRPFSRVLPQWTSMRYQSELALAYTHLGNITKAKEIIRKTVHHQRRLLLFGKDSKVPDLELLDHFKQKNLWQLLNDITSNNYDYLRHPDMMFSVEVMTKILSLKSEQAITLAIGINQANFAIRHVDVDLHRDTQSALKVAFDLAMLYKKVERWPEVEGLLEEVAEQHQLVLGARHPSTIAVKREWLVVKYRNGPYPTLFGDMSGLVKMQTDNLGPEHPETLRTLSVMLAWQVAFDDEGSLAARDNLLETLRSPSVMNQRLSESLAMEERIAKVYRQKGDIETEREILQAMVVNMNEKYAAEVKEFGMEDFRDHIMADLQLPVAER
ncbi:hypothetical protein PG987_006605 [Apiospora arundinis]